MNTTRHTGDDLLDVARVLLLVQGAILLATTIEAVLWGIAFVGAAGMPALLSGAAALTVLVARTRLRADRRWSRRLVYGVEGLILATLLLDTVVAVMLTGNVPPAVALLTRLLLPLSTILLLRRAAETAAAPVPARAGLTLEGTR